MTQLETSMYCIWCKKRPKESGMYLYWASFHNETHGYNQVQAITMVREAAKDPKLR